MKKWILLLLLILTMIPITESRVAIEISTDNLTWTSARFYGEIVNDINQTGSINNLQPDTLYYIRANDSTTNYTYTTYRTAAGGINQMEIALMILMVFLMLIFIIIAYISESEVIKIISLMIFMGFAWLAYALGLQMAKDGGATTELLKVLSSGYKFMTFTFIGILCMMFVYFLYSVVMTSYYTMKGENK